MRGGREGGWKRGRDGREGDGREGEMGGEIERERRVV